MRHHARNYVLVLIGAVVIGCGVDDSPVSPAELQEALVARNKELVAYGERNDAAGAASLHVLDAVLLPPGGMVVRGREVIREFLESPPGTRVHSTVIVPIKSGGTAEMAYLVGSYSYIVERYAEEGQVEGHFTIIWSRSPDEEWQVEVDMWNMKN